MGFYMPDELDDDVDRRQFTIRYTMRSYVFLSVQIVVCLCSVCMLFALCVCLYVCLFVCLFVSVVLSR